MQKKILFLILFLLILFLPGANASATQVFVGVTIATAIAPGSPSPEINYNWCLPIGTELSVRSSTNSVLPVVSGSGTVNPKYATTIFCAGSTMWSGLLDLDLSGATAYKIYLDSTPSGTIIPGVIVYSSQQFCSGVKATGIVGIYCFETAIGKSCNEICAHYGQTPILSGSSCIYWSHASDTCNLISDTCNLIAALKGSPCLSCECTTTYSYYSTTTDACWQRNSGYTGLCDYVPDPDMGLICACAHNTTNWSFNFDFTPSGI